MIDEDIMRKHLCEYYKQLKYRERIKMKRIKMKRNIFLFAFFVSVFFYVMMTFFVQYQAIRKWNGELPRITGSNAVPFVKVDEK